MRLHRPTGVAGRAPALLWIHGGGFVMGTAAQDDLLCRRVADELGAVVASAEYRLAPEARFPLPLHDCHDALAWLANRSDVDPTRVAVGGASAGGGLAAGLALLARDRGEVDVAFQLLTYPMLDDRTVCRTGIDERNFRLWNNRSNRFGWQSYTGLAPGSPDVSPLAAPARAPDLSGLPPAWIGVGTLDLFHDEDLEYAARLRAAGVPCEVLEVAGAFHGFDLVRRAEVVRAFGAAQVAAFAGASTVPDADRPGRSAALRALRLRPHCGGDESDGPGKRPDRPIGLDPPVAHQPLEGLDAPQHVEHPRHRQTVLLGPRSRPGGHCAQERVLLPAVGVHQGGVQRCPGFDRVGRHVLQDARRHRGHVVETHAVELDARLLFESVHDGVGQPALVPEVPVDGAFADAGTGGHGADREPRPVPDRAGVEELRPGRDDAVPRGRGLLPPSGGVVGARRAAGRPRPGVRRRRHAGRGTVTVW